MEGLDEARTALGRMDECLSKLQETGARDGSSAPDPQVINTFGSALDEDLNISAAWAAIFDWVRDTNRRISEQGLSPAEAAAALAGWERIDSVLGIGAAAESEVPVEILALVEARTAAKKAKDFKRADEIRAELKAKGWAVEDTPKGPKLKRL